MTSPRRRASPAASPCPECACVAGKSKLTAAAILPASFPDQGAVQLPPTVDIWPRASDSTFLPGEAYHFSGHPSPHGPQHHYPDHNNHQDQRRPQEEQPLPLLQRDHPAGQLAQVEKPPLPLPPTPASPTAVAEDEEELAPIPPSFLRAARSELPPPALPHLASAFHRSAIYEPYHSAPDSTESLNSVPILAASSQSPPFAASAARTYPRLSAAPSPLSSPPLPRSSSDTLPQPSSSSSSLSRPPNVRSPPSRPHTVSRAAVTAPYPTYSSYNGGHVSPRASLLISGSETWSPPPSPAARRLSTSSSASTSSSVCWTTGSNASLSSTVIWASDACLSSASPDRLQRADKARLALRKQARRYQAKRHLARRREADKLTAQAMSGEVAAKFFKARQFAVAGASQDTGKFGYKILAWYQQHRLPVTPINPRTPSITLSTLQGEPVLDTVASPSALPNPADTALSIVTPPTVTKQLLHEAKQVGIRYVWLQPGTYDDESLAYARNEFEAGVGGEEERVGFEGWCVLVHGEAAMKGAGSRI